MICSIHEKKFVYRGFLSGPYCPIYGFGALSFLLLASPFKGSWVGLFIAGTIIASVLEYITSYALEKSFNAKWWDYSDHKYNLNGRIALIPSLFWGFLSLVLIYFVNEPIHNLGDTIYQNFSIWPSLIIAIVMLADLTTTVVELVGFKKLMRDLSKELDSYKDKIQWTIDDYVNFLAERRRKSRLRFTERRTLKSFPRLSYKGLPSLNLDKPTLLAADKTIKKSKK
ncbi:putative ABC transporter permease [Candidatus Saccharibacteria bacterium]|nr:putative ABC transporter permease [Candidatus Saccharibacteria bacterium]